MRTQKQVEAARINGRKSKGPVTAEGKARSSANAICHGLSSKVVVLSHENPQTYDQLLSAYIDHWQPRNQVERDLVEDLVAARWRMHRLLAMETAALDLEVARTAPVVDREFAQVDQPGRVTLAATSLLDRGTTLSYLSRQESRLRRIARNAAAALTALQSAEKNLCTNEPEREAA